MHKSIRRAFARKSSKKPKVTGNEMSENSSTKSPANVYQDIKSEKHDSGLLSEYSWRSSKASFASETTLGESEPLGLHLLYPTARQLKTLSFEYASKLDEIDLVAIHDLGGPYHSSWTHGNGTLWLRDLLPDAFPRARIFSYGYRTEAFFADSELGFLACADELLAALREMRDGKELERPIVFVCHGLGGILCKQALLTASRRDGGSAIVAAIRGVIFLGTPHRLFSCHKFTKLFAELLPLGVYMSETKCIFASRQEMLLDALETKAPMVRTINSAYRSSKTDVEVFSLYTTSGEYRRSIISSHESSDTLTTFSLAADMCSEYLPLGTNHMDMGRFFGEKDPGYRMLVHILWRLVTSKALNRKYSSSFANSEISWCSHSFDGQELASSTGPQFYDHCKSVQDEINGRDETKPLDSIRRQVANQVLVAAGRGHKGLPHLPIPHLPVRNVHVPNLTSALRKPKLKLKLHRPTLKKLKLHKPEMKLPKPKFPIHGPKPFRYADAFDPEYSVERIYVRHHSPRIIRGKNSVALQAAHSSPKKDKGTFRQASGVPSPKSLSVDLEYDGVIYPPHVESINSQDPFDRNDLDSDRSSFVSCCTIHGTECIERRAQMGADDCGKKGDETVCELPWKTADTWEVTQHVEGERSSRSARV